MLPARRFIEQTCARVASRNAALQATVWPMPTPLSYNSELQPETQLAHTDTLEVKNRQSKIEPKT